MNDEAAVRASLGNMMPPLTIHADYTIDFANTVDLKYT
jgi:hypothetical protein